jgi:hypothetical protein
MRSKNERNWLFWLFLGDDSDRFGTYYISISYLVKYGSSDMLIFKIWNRMRSLENSLDDFGEDPGEICKGHPKFPKKENKFPQNSGSSSESAGKSRKFSELPQQRRVL